MVLRNENRDWVMGTGIRNGKWKRGMGAGKGEWKQRIGKKYGNRNRECELRMESGTGK